MPPNRAQRAKIAKGTLEVIKQGHYVNGGGDKIDISEALASATTNSR